MRSTHTSLCWVHIRLPLRWPLLEVSYCTCLTIHVILGMVAGNTGTSQACRVWKLTPTLSASLRSPHWISINPGGSRYSHKNDSRCFLFIFQLLYQWRKPARRFTRSITFFFWLIDAKEENDSIQDAAQDFLCARDVCELKWGGAVTIIGSE